MENSHQHSKNNEALEKQSKEKHLSLNQIIINNESTSINNKKEITNTLPLLEDTIKLNNNTLPNQSEKPRKSSVIKIEGIKQDETNKDNQERKLNIIRKERKNQTVNMVRKPRKNDELGGTIKVIGKVSAKLETLIKRLGQNINNENISNTRIENKYVMGPKIKAALEMFNKKKEDEEKKQKMPFTKRIYKYVIVPDSEEDKKSQSVREKANFIKEIDEDKYENNNEEEEDNDRSVDIDNNKNKMDSDNKYLSSNNKKENNKKKRKKKNSIKVLNLSRDSSSDNEEENNKINIKRKRKKHREENSNSKSSLNENSEESVEEDNKTNKNKKRQSITKKETFNFSEDKSEKSQEEKAKENEDDEEITPNLVKHKSGKAEIYICLKNVSRTASIRSSDQSDNSIKKNKDTKNNQITQQNPININNWNKNNEKIRNQVLKIVDYDKFTYKQYIVKNYHPKPVTLWKKQIEKYIPSKQIDFSLFAIKDINNIRDIKDIYFNHNNSNNEYNKRRTVKKKERKSVCPNNNKNFLFNFKKKFGIQKFKENIYNFDYKKNTQINNEIEVPRKRYQSIILNNNISINEFAKKFNKNNVKKNKNNVHDILLKKGINSINPETNNKQNKKVKFNVQNVENHLSNKNQENIINDIPEREKENSKENEVIKETHFGVKYIVFQNKNELKTLFKKEQWKLSIDKVSSIFLKSINNSNIKNISNNNNTVKNLLEIETLSKNNFDKSNKIEKTSFKYISNGKIDNNNNNKNKINDFSNKLNESNNSSSNSDISTKNILNNKYNNETINKDYDDNKENDNIKKQIHPTNHLYFNYISNINCNKETKKSKNELLVKSVNSVSNINESLYKKNDINYSTELNNNNSLKNTLTNKARKINRKCEFITEKNDKKISKVKSKKARIKKFKSLKDDSEYDNNKIKRKEKLYDCYTSKKQNERKKFVKEDCYKQNTLNINDKIKNSKYGFNTYKKSISLKKCSSGNNRNHSSNKKYNAQVNPITFLKNNNNKQSSLIMNYRQKIIEGMSNQYYNSNNIKNANNKNVSKNNVNKSMTALRRKNDIKLKLNLTKEISKIEAIKSRMKKRLIEINDKLIDAINYFNGPIDISCISTKNYSETVQDLAKKALKNGYQCSKLETNYYKLENSNNIFLVEIVKIRNNLLYYLIVKKK